MGPDALARLCAQQRGECHELQLRPSTFCLHPKPHLHLRGSASLETWSERCKKSVHTPTSPSILYHVSICASPCLKQEQGRKHNSGSLAASKRQRQGRGRSQQCARPMEDSAQIASKTVTHTTKAMPHAARRSRYPGAAMFPVLRSAAWTVCARGGDETGGDKQRANLTSRPAFIMHKAPTTNAATERDVVVPMLRFTLAAPPSSELSRASTPHEARIPGARLPCPASVGAWTERSRFEQNQISRCSQRISRTNWEKQNCKSSAMAAA